MNERRASFRFLIPLASEPHGVLSHGPLFHRWLPDGEKDGIELAANGGARLRVWHRRWGFIGDDGEAVFSLDRQELDDATISRNAVLDGGPLIAQLDLSVSAEEADALEAGGDDDQLLALGKRVAQLLHPPVGQFLTALRTHYGQYWIRAFEPWDSRTDSIGHYCRMLYAKWSWDCTEWRDFKPGGLQITIKGTVHRDYAPYLTREDWNALREIVSRGFRASPGASVLARTHELADRGQTRQAFVEAATALEMIVDECLQRRSRELPRELKRLVFDLPLKRKTVLTGIISGLVTPAEVNGILQALEIRNGIVHEGKEPPPDAHRLLGIVLQAIARFLDGPGVRFPTATPGNSWVQEGEWNPD